MRRRRQLTAFVPPPVGTRIDALRRRWDPVMAERIDAHVTVCHDLADDLEDGQQLDGLAALGPLTLLIGGASVWERTSDGIYLSVSDVHSRLVGIRDSVGCSQPPDTPFRPHITITHPRTVPADAAADAWRELQHVVFDDVVTIDRLVVIEDDGSRWRPVRVVPLR